MKLFRLAVAALFIGATTSCVPVKKMIYLQSEEDITEKVFEYQKEEYKLQVNDILDVQIRSMNEEANKLFSIQGNQGQQAMQAGVQSGRLSRSSCIDSTVRAFTFWGVRRRARR